MSTAWVMRTTQEHVNRAGKVPPEYAESASSHVNWKRWRSADSSHYVCLIGYSGCFLSVWDESNNFFNQEREFCLNEVMEEFVIQIHGPATATPSPGYTNIAVRLEQGEDGSIVQHEASSSRSDSHGVLATLKLGMCITVSRRDCEAADSATVQHHPRVKSKGLCYKMPGFEMELLGDLVLADGLSDGEGLWGQTLNFKIIDDEDDDFCIRFTRIKNSTNNGVWTIVTTTFQGASSNLEPTTYNNEYFVSESKDVVINNSVGESHSGDTIFTMQFVVQHGFSEESSNIDNDSLQDGAIQQYQGFHELPYDDPQLPYDDPQYQDFYQRDIALLQYQMRSEANILEFYRDAIDNSNRIAQQANIAAERNTSRGCRCCEEKGCWHRSCNTTKCRYRCNCW